MLEATYFLMIYLQTFKFQRNEYYLELLKSKYATTTLSENIDEILILMFFLANEYSNVYESLENKIFDLKAIKSDIEENEKINEAKTIITDFVKIINFK